MFLTVIVLAKLIGVLKDYRQRLVNVQVMCSPASARIFALWFARSTVEFTVAGGPLEISVQVIAVSCQPTTGASVTIIAVWPVET